MSGAERLAGDHLLRQLKQACLDDDVHISRKTDRLLAARGIPSRALLAAIVRHITDGYKVHAKIIPGIQACHGSLLIDPDDSETVYFEAKIQRRQAPSTFAAVWVQAHKHDTGYPPLSR